jgi:hypothetical protein
MRQKTLESSYAYAYANEEKQELINALVCLLREVQLL